MSRQKIIIQGDRRYSLRHPPTIDKGQDFFIKKDDENEKISEKKTEKGIELGLSCVSFWTLVKLYAQHGFHF